MSNDQVQLWRPSDAPEAGCIIPAEAHQRIFYPFIILLPSALRILTFF